MLARWSEGNAIQASWRLSQSLERSKFRRQNFSLSSQIAVFSAIRGIMAKLSNCHILSLRPFLTPSKRQAFIWSVAEYRNGRKVVVSRQAAFGLNIR